MQLRPQLSEAYVLGLLAELEVRLPEVAQTLEKAELRAVAIDAELGNLVRRLSEVRAGRERAEQQFAAATAAHADRNQRAATLHQEIGTFQRSADELKIEIDNTPRGPVHRQMRRERGAMLVAIEDRQAELADLQQAAAGQRRGLHDGWVLVEDEKKHEVVITRELDALQAQLPSPALLIDLFELGAARAHCRFFLGRQLVAWKAELGAATERMSQLHTALRAGKYRLDKNSDVVGGRALATGEAMYGSVTCGEAAQALELFEQATDPALFFHHIFNVFRVWCLGLYLAGQRAELTQLLRGHRYAEGLRGGYVQAFSGLLADDARGVAAGVKDIVKHEWQLHVSARGTRGLGVVNLGAAAIVRLALEARLDVAGRWPTVPTEIIVDSPTRTQRRRRS